MAAGGISISGACCLVGYIATGTPTGEFVTLGGVKTYLAKPEGPTPKKAIIMFTDVFGVGVPNTLLVADSFAKQGGFLVAVPDLFHGSPLSPQTQHRMVELMGVGDTGAVTAGVWLQRRLRNTGNIFLIMGSLFPFLARHGSWARKMPIAEGVYNSLKSDYGVEHFGAIGYCYGGGFCFQWATLADKLDAFVVAHTQIKVPDSLRELQKPGLIICADRDFSLTDKQRAAMEEYLEKSPPAAPCSVSFYPGTYHGFTCRGDETNPLISKAKEDAFQEALALFSKHVGA